LATPRNLLEAANETEVLGQFLIFGVVALDRHVRGGDGQCVCSFPSAFEKLAPFVTLHRLAIKFVEAEKEHPISDDSALGSDRSSRLVSLARVAFEAIVEVSRR
jgi:hypothetical protein